MLAFDKYQIRVWIARSTGSGFEKPRRTADFDTGYQESVVEAGDFDGDGLDDLLSVGPSATPKVADILVALSSGRKFANATSWGTWRYDLRGAYGTQAIGETFP